MEETTYTIHIYYNGKAKLERHFKISQTRFEMFVLNRAFWTACHVEVYRPTFELFSLSFTYFYIEDYNIMEKWLNEHKLGA